MKWLILCLLLASCSVPFGTNQMGYEELDEPLFSSWAVVSAHTYMPEHGEYWKSPVEFERDGGGDCEDFAIALLYRLGREASMMKIQTSQGLHAIVEWRGYYLDPQTFLHFYDVKALEVLHVYSYEDTLKEATAWGSKTQREAIWL